MSDLQQKKVFIQPELIQAAHDRIRAEIIKTPIKSFYDKLTGASLHFKLENKQHTGSFKARGSLNKIMIEKEKGTPHIITASTGNHALGVARALSIVDMKGQIVLPVTASKAKIEKLRKFPVELTFVEGTSLESELAAKDLAESKKSIWISPYNDEGIIAGQGTIGIEIVEQCPAIDAICVTVGGGGLISGIASWIKANYPHIKIIGCQPLNSAEMYESVQAKRIVDVPYQTTLSDGSAGGIEPDAITFPICSSLIDDFSLITESEIAEAIKWMHGEFGERIEGAAGVAVSSALKLSSKYKNIVAVVCGGNIDEKTFSSIVKGN